MTITTHNIVRTVKVHFSECEKIMRIGQNGPLEKFTRFLFMHLNVACITNIWRDNIYDDTNLCDRPLTRIMRINKTRAEKCRFTVVEYHVTLLLMGVANETRFVVLISKIHQSSSLSTISMI